MMTTLEKIHTLRTCIKLLHNVCDNDYAKDYYDYDNILGILEDHIASLQKEWLTEDNK